jgi:hypothetical protein
VYWKLTKEESDVVKHGVKMKWSANGKESEASACEADREAGFVDD